MNLLVTKETRKNRLESCRTCHFFTRSQRCRKCGCFMKVKSFIPHVECPIGRWGKEDGK